MHDHRCVTKVESFAEQVGGDQQIDPVGGARRRRAECARRESGERLPARERAARYARAARRERGHSAGCRELAVVRERRVRELREGDDALTRVGALDLAELCGARGVDGRLLAGAAGERA